LKNVVAHGPAILPHAVGPAIWSLIVNVDVILPNDMEILEEAFEIALSVLLRSGELEELDEASHFLAAEIAELMSMGEKSSLLLSNFAIDAYRLKHGCRHLRIVQ